MLLHSELCLSVQAVYLISKKGSGQAEWLVLHKLSKKPMKARNIYGSQNDRQEGILKGTNSTYFGTQKAQAYGCDEAKWNHHNVVILLEVFSLGPQSHMR